MRVPNSDEIKSVVDTLHLDKSRGPDVFNGAFFQEFLGDLKNRPSESNTIHLPWINFISSDKHKFNHTSS